jgi:SAM-dependent methyltransferase
MNPSIDERSADFYIETYDLAGPIWPGEIAFYREMAAEARFKGGGVLEIGCGTGRVAIRLAQDGIDVVGFDLFPKMLEVAREKSMGLQNIRWVLADIRSFELGETFGRKSRFVCIACSVSRWSTYLRVPVSTSSRCMGISSDRRYRMTARTWFGLREAGHQHESLS